MSIAGLLILVLSVLVSIMCCDGFQTTFVLERIDSKSLEHVEVIIRDRIRHDQKSSMNGIINFPLEGPNLSGFYFTRMKIGNPPKDYYMVIDTGSDITWVNCNPCIGCPRISTVVQLSFFDPRNSYSAETLSCSGRVCMSLPNSRFSTCYLNPLCNYSMFYGDESEVSGYYLLDAFHFDTIMGNSASATSTTSNVIFGCTNNQSGSLTNPQSAFDGLLGLGPHPMSFLSQLEAQGIMPNVFSHCLNREYNGGRGILVLGEIVDPNIIYTPLVPKQTHYMVNLLSISINGQTLPIDPQVFSISRDRRGTMVDSGTTYSYLTEEAYDPFITALYAVVPPSLISYTMEGRQCFVVSRSIRDVFPLISLNFAGGASMVLKPETYLVYNHNAGGRWCVGFHKSQFQNDQTLTILGELVLKDKVIVYDLARQRLGWVDYNCSSSVSVSLVPPRVSRSSRLVLYHQLIPIAAGGFFVYLHVCWLLVFII